MIAALRRKTLLTRFLTERPSATLYRFNPGALDRGFTSDRSGDQRPPQRRPQRNDLRKIRQSAPRSPVERILSGANGASSFEDEESHDDSGDSSRNNFLAFSADTVATYSDVIDKIVSGKRFRRQHTRKPIPLEVSDPVVEYLRREEAPDDSSELLPTIKVAFQRESTDQSSGSIDLKTQLKLDISEQR